MSQQPLIRTLQRPAEHFAGSEQAVDAVIVGNGALMAGRSWADVVWFGALGALLLHRRLRPSGFLLVHRDRWLPPSVDISLSYTCGIGITARLLTVNIWHKLRQPILW